MLAFECDYLEGAHEKILNRLIETNMEKLPGYGADPYCASAREKILDACQCPEGEVFFLVGGTQTNATVIDGLLSSYEGVVSAETGHVNCHESGAIEASGHKVITLPHHEGKLDAGELEGLLKTFWGDETYEHMVFPGMVYISHPTEYGTLYTKDELKGLHQVCKAYGIPLYMDGARLGYGLAAHGTDVTLPVIAEYCDGRPCTADRCILHRRNEGGSSLRRGRCVPEKGAGSEALFHHHQAAWSTFSQKTPSGDPV